jgi:hypothetical protein
MPLTTDSPVAYAADTTPGAVPALPAFATEFDAIVAAMSPFIEGGRAGQSAIMRHTFLPDATIVGYVGDTLLSGSIEQLYGWIDENGPAPHIEARVAAVEILHSIAMVRMEFERWSGKLAGAETHMSDVFTLVKTGEGWRIAHKCFHWHAQ